jgi:ClpP class serine protease
MGYAERKALIHTLETQRESRVVSLFFSDRMSFPPGVPGFGIQMDTEPQGLLLDLLDAMGRVKKLDLLLYTRGGATDSVWPLVVALRSYCDRFSVLIPHRAHSAGTMVCLGADEIVMTDRAELSPIDATTGNAFNPRDPTNPQSIIGISVEDVAAYFELSKRLGRIEEQPYRLQVFQELTKDVRPLALGNVERVHQLIRRLAKQLLSLHISKETLDIERIVDALTREFFSHTHAIMRTEAQSIIGKWVVAPKGELETALLGVLAQYVKDLDLRRRFTMPKEMGDEPRKEFKIIGALLESTDISYKFETDVRALQRPLAPQGQPIQVPPGQQAPLTDFVQRAYDYGIQSAGWVENPEED